MGIRSPSLTLADVNAHDDKCVPRHRINAYSIRQLARLKQHLFIVDVRLAAKNSIALIVQAQAEALA